MKLSGRAGSIFAVMGAPVMLVMIVVSYTGFWFFSIARVKDWAAAWAGDLRNRGYSVSYKVEGSSGFPFGINVRFSDVSLRLEREKIAASAPLVEVRAPAFSPHALRVRLPRGGRLALPVEAKPLELLGGDGDLTARVTIDSAGVLRKLAVEGRGLGFGGAWQGKAFASPLKVGRIDAQVGFQPTLTSSPSPDPPVTVTFAFALRDLRLPRNLSPTLGTKLDSFDLSGRMFGMFAGFTPLMENLRDWRDAKGRVKVERLSLDWGAVRLAAEGTFGLDANLQLEANLIARIEGFVPLVDALEQAGLIRPRDATMGRLVIGHEMPLSRPGSLGMSLHDQKVYIGAHMLTEVPPLLWDKPPRPKPTHLTRDGKPLLAPGVDIGISGERVQSQP